MTTDALTLDALSDPVPPYGAGGLDWNTSGVSYRPGLIPDEFIEAYKDEWCRANGFYGLGVVDPDDRQAALAPLDRLPAVKLHANRPGGWPDCTPYMRHEALRAICTYGPLAEMLEGLMGEPAGVHLNLSGWVTTERNWHQDGYLNPWTTGDYYAAVWIALGNIHPDSGPFQFVPGSHMWHRLTRDKIAPHVDLDNPSWPKHTEDFLTPLVRDEIIRRDVNVVDHLPATGEVMAWHPRLYHRGSKAIVPGAYRPALIAHFSGIRHRPDMPPAVQSEWGGWYFPIEDSGPSS